MVACRGFCASYQQVGFRVDFGILFYLSRFHSQFSRTALRCLAAVPCISSLPTARFLVSKFKNSWLPGFQILAFRARAIAVTMRVTRQVPVTRLPMAQQAWSRSLASKVISSERAVPF